MLNFKKLNYIHRDLKPADKQINIEIQREIEAES